MRQRKVSSRLLPSAALEAVPFSALSTGWRVALSAAQAWPREAAIAQHNPDLNCPVLWRRLRHGLAAEVAHDERFTDLVNLNTRGPPGHHRSLDVANSAKT